jgi:hypothetical protein
VTTQHRRPVPSPAAELVLPSDGKVDLGDGDWVRLSTKLTVERMLGLLAAFDAYEESSAALPKGRVAGGIKAQIELAVSSLAVLVVEASVRDEDGKEIDGTDESALRKWDTVKLMKAGSYAQAVKAQIKSPGI